MANGIQVVFDCADPPAMAAFWSEALGYIVQPPPPGFDSWPEFLRSIGWAEEDLDRASAIVDPDERGPRVYFQKVPEGKVAKNRVHLDVNVAAEDLRPEEHGGRLRSEAEHLSALGAVELVRAARDRRPLDHDAEPRGQRVLPPVKRAGAPGGP